MDGSIEARSDYPRAELLVRWLGGKDEQKKQAAAALFCRVGRPVAPALIKEAIRDGKRPHHRIAILDVVQQIGGPPETNEIFDLQTLLLHRNPSVRQKAEEVIMSYCSGGLPISPEEYALLRAVNPLLWIPPRVSAKHRRKRNRFLRAGYI